MGPKEAALAVNKYFSSAHTVIPMSYETTETFPGPGRFMDFFNNLEEWQESNQLINTKHEKKMKDKTMFLEVSYTTLKFEIKLLGVE